MKRMNLGYLCAVAVLGAAMCVRAARADGVNGLYFGGSFGRSQNTYDTAFVDDQYQQAATAVGDKLEFDSSSTHRTADTWWADVGCLPWTYVGFDASFIHLGELTHRAGGTLHSSTGDKPVTTTATVTSHGPALALLARLPLTDSLDLDVRLGDYDAKTALTHGLLFQSKYTASVQSANSSSLLVSAGAAYTFAGHWSVRLDYLRINRAGNGNTVGNYSANVATAGAAFTF